MMAHKLPADFDPERYSAAYPDVALSGLSAREHYLRFGRLLGRSPTGKGAKSAPAAKKPPADGAGQTPTQMPPPSAPDQRQAAAPTTEPSKSAAGSAGAAAPSPIIDRPAEFDSQDVVVMPARGRSTDPKDGRFTLDVLAAGISTAEAGQASLAAPLTAYARLCGVTPLAGVEDQAPRFGGIPALFRVGETRIENGWYVEKNRLRLMIAGGTEKASTSTGWSFRAFQATPSALGQLRQVGAGFTFPRTGPVLHDLELVHPLTPLLLELANADGLSQGFALLPFPSLLPGGLHGAELKALQEDPNPMDAFWSLSERLLLELLGGSDAQPRSITELSSQGAEAPLLSEEVGDWLNAIFRLGPEVPAEGPEPGGLRLRLPADSVPTISALVSRRLDLGGAKQAAAPYLVADDATHRARWFVSPPADLVSSDLPLLEGKGTVRRGKRMPQAVPIHVAIVSRPTAHVPKLVDETQPRTVMDLPLTILLESTDPSSTKRLVQDLNEAGVGEAMQLLVRMPGRQTEIADALDQACGVGRWTDVQDLDLCEIASRADHEILVTISDRIGLAGARSLKVICDLLKADEKTASASCLLLGEGIVKKQAILYPASGGLFPSRVSFASSPRLSFFEPDVSQALPNLAYPVVANSLHFTAWRAPALAGLPRASAPVPSSADEVRIGLDLLDAGYRNLCTTNVHAVYSGPLKRRDSIDPVGASYLRPAFWEKILERVVVVRELF